MSSKFSITNPLVKVAGAGTAIGLGTLFALLTGNDPICASLIVGTALGILGDVGNEVLGSAIEQLTPHQTSKEDILKNGDLTRAIGMAIFTVINDEAGKKEYGTFREIMGVVGGSDGDEWQKYLDEFQRKWQRYTEDNLAREIEPTDKNRLIFQGLEKLSVNQSTQYLTAKEGELDNLKALTPEVWSLIVKGLFQSQTYQPKDKVCRGLGQRLYDDFPKAFRKVLNDDFRTDGAAFASMQLRLSGEILQYAKDNNRVNEELLTKVDYLIEQSNNCSQPLEELGKNIDSLTALKSELVESLRLIDHKTGDFGSKVGFITSTLKDFETEIKDIRAQTQITREELSKQLRAIEQQLEENRTFHAGICRNFVAECKKSVKEIKEKIEEIRRDVSKTKDASSIIKARTADIQKTLAEIIFNQSEFEKLQSETAQTVNVTNKVLERLSIRLDEIVKTQNKISIDITHALRNLGILMTGQDIILLELDEIKSLLRNQPAKPSLPEILPRKNPPRRVQYFTGREQVLTKIAESLTHHGTAAFADTHGVGKSSVVIEFACRNFKNYRKVFFIRATANEFDLYVSEIVKDLGYELPDNVPSEQRLAVFQAWLAENQNWLLVVDNVDDVKFINQCKFDLPNGFVIYTSNNEQIYGLRAKVELPRMLDENAVLLLYKHWKNNPAARFDDIPENARSPLKGIAGKFGNHPFSMAFVGSYLAEEQENLAEFLEVYQSKEANLLEKYEFLSHYQHQNVATAFLLRFEQISRRNDDTDRERFLSAAVKAYLKLSAFTGTDNIPEELLQQSLAILYPDREAFTGDKVFIKDIYKRFKPTSIFKRDADNRTLSTHRIVQEIMRYRLANEEDLILETLARVLAANFEPFDFTNKEKVERYLSHAGTFLEYLEASKPTSQENLTLENKEIGRLFNRYARYYEQYGQYEKAEKYYLYFKQICERVKDIDQTLISASYNNLAGLYQTQGKYELAEKYYLKALVILEKELGENHPETAMTYNNLAGLYETQGKYELAEKYYLKALVIREKELGENHPETATTYSNLAAFYQTQGKYELAEKYYLKALAILEKELGENHPETATTYSNLAALYFNKGNLELAREYQQKSFKARLNNFGEDHPNVALSYWWLGVFYNKEEKFQEALDNFRKAKEIYLRFLPEEHPNLQKLQRYIDDCENLLK